MLYILIILGYYYKKYSGSGNKTLQNLICFNFFQNVTTQLSQEIESIRAMNSSLRAYLEHLRSFKKNLIAMNDNCTQLNKVNEQWIGTLRDMK